MPDKIYAIVGNWGFSPAPKGITTYEYVPETGGLKMIETIREDIPAGQMYLDRDANMLYVCNEVGERRGEVGGGGSILAFRLNPDTGKLTLMNEQESLCPEPSYITMDKEKKYLLVCHCSDPWHVTKLVRRADGTFANKVLFDDTGLVLFRVAKDGGIGDICDVAVTIGVEGKSEESEVNIDPVSGHIQLVQVISRLHCVVPSPDSSLFVVCDKGMDRIYTFRVDQEQGKLVQLDCYQTAHKVFPRYAAFHPHLPVFYANNEFSPTLTVLSYDKASGAMTHLGDTLLLFKEVGMVEGKPVGAQDILVAPNGKTLYCSLVGVNSIAVLELDCQGIPTLVQVVFCGGRMPRAIQLSPDGRFLFSGNMLSGNITTLKVLSDGTLEETGIITDAVSPSVICFYA